MSATVAWLTEEIGELAQAVRDDPRIKERIRVYFIASWNQRQDPAAAAAKLDTAWLAARSDAARSALDSVRVSEFGLQSLLETGPTVPSDPPGS